MKHTFFLSVLAGFLFVTVTGGVFAQSNERLDELLGQSPARNGHGAYLVLSAAGVIDESATPEQAFDRAREQGLFSGGDHAGDDLTFGRFSFLLMESFGEPGGVMYRLLPGPRYAAREVVYQEWSRRRRVPREPIDGDTAMRVLSVYINSTARQAGR